MNGLRPGWAVKAIVVVIFTSMLFRCVSATPESDFAAAATTTNTNHSVGGASGWDLSSNIPAWATQVTFYVGDLLVFRYTPSHDVLEVDKMDYDLCHTVNPIESHRDGETVIQLRQAGHRYFMCGRAGHCAMGLKLHVQVHPSSQRITTTTTSPSPTPPPTANATTTATSSSPPLASPSPNTTSPSSEDQAAAGGNLVPSPNTNTSVNSTTATSSSDAKDLKVGRAWLALVIVAVLMMQSCSPLVSIISLLLVLIFNRAYTRRQ